MSSPSTPVGKNYFDLNNSIDFESPKTPPRSAKRKCGDITPKNENPSDLATDLAQRAIRKAGRSGASPATGVVITSPERPKKLATVQTRVSKTPSKRLIKVDASNNLPKTDSKVQKTAKNAKIAKLKDDQTPSAIRLLFQKKTK